MPEDRCLAGAGPVLYFPAALAADPVPVLLQRILYIHWISVHISSVVVLLFRYCPVNYWKKWPEALICKALSHFSNYSLNYTFTNS